MVKIVWVSRHDLNEKNYEILEKAFGDVEVYQYSDTVKDVPELIEFADEVGADAYVVVLPPHLIMELQKKDKRPIYRFVVERIVNDDGSVTVIPVGLERVVEVKIVTERIV